MTDGALSTNETAAPKWVRWEVGDRVDIYEIVDPVGFAGHLPTARIVEGTNAGVPVILHRPYKKAAPEEGGGLRRTREALDG